MVHLSLCLKIRWERERERFLSKHAEENPTCFGLCHQTVFLHTLEKYSSVLLHFLSSCLMGSRSSWTSPVKPAELPTSAWLACEEQQIRAKKYLQKISVRWDFMLQCISGPLSPVSFLLQHAAQEDSEEDVDPHSRCILPQACLCSTVPSGSVSHCSSSVLTIRSCHYAKPKSLRLQHYSPKHNTTELITTVPDTCR